MIEYKGGQFFYSFAVNGKSAVTVSSVDLRTTEAMVKCVYNGKPDIDFAAFVAQAQRERHLNQIWTLPDVVCHYVEQCENVALNRAVLIERNGVSQFVRLIDLTGEEIDTLLERWIHE